MFGDVFDTTEDLLNGDQTAVLNSYQRKPKNCAADLDLPSMKRDSSTFVGLKNQGATCYLNSLLQSVYMIPEFRNVILRLPLCAEDDCTKPSNFVSQSKFNFLYPLQLLFSELQSLDVRALSTEEVTKAFGWNNNEQLMQQDIQEAYRIIFDILERALEGTEYSQAITKNFKGLLVNHLECLNCGVVNERDQDFYDLIVQVKGVSSIEESLLNMLTMERLEGSNQYHCDICNKKVDALKGFKVRKYPPILTFSLSRFDFDYEKMQRMKINDKFSFNVELDVSMFAENPEIYTTEDEKIYELCAILIHRGDAFGGHYKAYIRDTMNEGDWNGLMTRYSDDRKKKTDKMETEVKEGQENQTAPQSDTTMPVEVSDNKDNGMQVENEGEQSTTVKVNGEKKEEAHNGEANTDDEDDEETESPNKTDAKQPPRKKPKTKKNKKSKKKHSKPSKANNLPNKKKTDNEDDKNKSKQKYDDSVFDDVEFPFPFQNQDLKFKWFDFNDSSVTAIPINRIQHQFGGSSESAYILIYRQRALNNSPDFRSTTNPTYIQKAIEEKNLLLENERIVYNEAERNIECIFFEPTKLDYDNKAYVSEYDPNMQGKKLKIRQDTKIGDLFDRVTKELPELNLNAQDLILVETSELGNKHVQFKRRINSGQKDLALEEAGFDHLSTFAVFPNDKDERYNSIVSKIGDDFVPIRVNIRHQGKDFRVLTYHNELFENLRLRFQEILELPLDLQYILLMKDQGPVYLNKDQANDSKKLVELGVNDNADFIINKIDEAQLKAQKIEKEVEQTQDKMRTRGAVKEEKRQEDEILSSQTENLTSVLVESDDRNGVIRYFVDLDWKLQDLVDNIKKKLDVDPTSSRRLRRLLGNSLFYEEELALTLRQLAFEEGGIRLKLEYGRFPQYGNLTVKVRNQSKFKKEDDKYEDDIICFPNELISELKKKACEAFGLDPFTHKLYKTDWLEDPVQVFAKEDRSVQANLIKMADLIILKDTESSIPKEILNFQVHFTPTGSHSDSEYVDIVQIKEEQTLEEFKLKLLSMPLFSRYGNVSPSCVRVREMRKDMFFGKILRNDKKQLKKFDLGSSTALVVQILTQPESLSEDELVLLVRKRMVETKTYDEPRELVFSAGQAPQINELKQAIISLEELDVDLPEIELAKYFPHEFEWFYVSKEYMEAVNKKKKKGGKGKNQGKKGGKKGGNAPTVAADDIENLKKAPYLLKDGDIIGYRITFECLEMDDDFQTQEDQDNRAKFLQEKARQQAEISETRINRDRDAGGLQIYTDF